MFRAALISAALLTALTLPSAASAQVPAQGSLSLSVQRDYGYRGQQIALSGQTLRLKGVVTPYVAGEQVAVRIALPGGAFTARRTLVQQGSRGVFFVNFRARRTGRITVTATKDATPALGALSGTAKPVTVIGTRAGAGASGLRVRFLQQRLQALRYLIDPSGSYDGGTQRAVLAFRKVNRMARITTADERIFTLLARYQGAFQAKHPNHGKHVETDLQRQVLALVNPGGKVFKVIHTATGTSSTPTVVGGFRFYRKDFGTNSLGMVHSSYFIGGYAIHGYSSVPTAPASHGCLRIPISNARFVFRWIGIGDRIDVYLRGGRTRY